MHVAGSFAIPWLDALIGSWWLYPALYALVVADAFLVVVPGEIAVAALGALAMSTDPAALWLLIPVAAAGALTGDLACYGVGRAVGLDRWRWQREGRLGAAVARVRSVALRRTAALVFTARYIPFARIAVNLSIGAARLPLRRYLPLAAGAGLAWACFQVGVGTAFGAVFREHPLLAVIASAVAALGLGLVIDRAVAAVRARRTVERDQHDGVPFERIDPVGDEADRTTTGGTMTSTPQPPFAPDAAEILNALHEFFPKHITADIAPAMREPIPGVPTNLELAQEAHPGLSHREVTVPGYQGDEITLSIWEPADGVKSGAGIYYIHGGGMMIGDRFLGALEYAQWADELNAVVVSVEYRLAPEHAYPTQTEDSYAGFVWFAENAASLGVDASNIVVAGASAGGNLAAAVALIARDRKGPAIKGQLLEYPMLDDTQSTTSAQVYREVGLWSGTSGDSGWAAFLGELAPGSDAVPAYAAPARATDLSGLPPAFIDVGECELFRDEDVAYATRLWAAGVSAELHVTPGIWHAFESFAADHPTSEIIRKRRLGWLRGVLAG